MVLFVHKRRQLIIDTLGKVVSIFGVLVALLFNGLQFLLVLLFRLCHFVVDHNTNVLGVFKIFFKHLAIIYLYFFIFLMNNSNKSSTKQAITQNKKANFTLNQVVGSGTFGMVYLATNNETGEKVAIKKVFQDKRYKNREHLIIQELNHPTCIKLKQSFFT